MRTFLLSAAAAVAVASADSIDKFVKYDQRACPWRDFKEEVDYTFFTRDNDDPVKCAQACLDTAGCTGYEVGPHTSADFNDKMYCALWLNSNCNDESQMLHLGGYKAMTFVLTSALPKVATTAAPTEAKTAISQFVEYNQRACPWRAFKEEVDYTFYTRANDDPVKCAQACLDTAGCTGYEVGPATSSDFNNKMYCALWLKSNCNDESHMLHLGGYKAKTFVLISALPATVAPKAAPTTESAEDKANAALTQFIEYNQRACPWSEYKENTDFTFFTRENDDPAKCAQACVDTAGCTGYEVGPHTNNYEDKMYCALWLNSNCNDVSKMLHLGGYQAKTFVLSSALPVLTTVAPKDTKKKEALPVLTTVAPKDTKKKEEFENEVETAITKMKDSLDKERVAFEKAAKKNPELLFAKLPQRACPWSRFKQGQDWSFASKKSDDVPSCAAACVAAEGCTGFEVGPHTSDAFNSISYCALWFHGKCSSEKDMLHLNPKDYQAVTYVLGEEFIVGDLAGVKTPYGKVNLEGEEMFQPEVSKEHYEDAGAETEEGAEEDKEIVGSFHEYPQLACAFDQYKQGRDWSYYTSLSDGSSQANSCGAACLKQDGCTGFEIGRTAQGDYCALWMHGACSDKEHMTKVPADYQTVTTFVLASYKRHYHGYTFYTFAFMAVCLAAMLCSIVLTTCVCYKVCRRVCARTVIETPVPGELVQATVVNGTPVGQRVDCVVVLRGEPVVSGEKVEEK